MSGEFPAVAATNQNNKSSAFAEALERAKQVAARIGPNSSSSDPLKRKPEDSSLGEPEKKRTVLPPLVGANSTNNSSSSSAALEAAQRAAKVADVLTRQGMQGIGAAGVSTSPVSSKDIKVPDKMVGLIIGRGGEQITRLQAESGCKIQMAADSRGMPERVCTLTGNTQAISKAEDLISQIVQSRSREMMSMGNGASISPNMNSLSNSGPGLNDSMGNAGLPPSISTVSTPTFTQVEIMVPGPKVGLIIGKGGETIKQLQEKSGAKMVVIQDGPSQEAEKPLRISGDPQKVEHAKALVYEFMAEKDQNMQQKGRGRSGGGYGPNSNNSRSWDSDIVESTIAVPAGKCGVIIGKGGETIKQINQQTGAHCEIDRKQQPNATEKIFVVKGTPDQIEHAKRLFSEKLNMHLGGNNSNGHGNSYSHGSGMQGSHSMGSQNFNGGGPWSGPFGPNSQPSQYPWPSTSPGQGQQQQMHASGGDAAAGGNVAMHPATGQLNYSAQWVEYYKSMGMIKEAAVIEEQANASKMNASNMQEMQANFQAMQANSMSIGLSNMQQGQLMSMNQPQQSMASSQQSPQPNQNQTEQADYSAQWAQYYRSLGKIKYAEAIEAHMKAKQGMNQTQSGTPSGVAQQQQQPNANSLSTVFNQNAAAMTAQYGLGTFPTAASAQGYNAPQYAYPNYGAYQQQSGASSGNDALP